jgi:hypothetical protein
MAGKLKLSLNLQSVKATLSFTDKQAGLTSLQASETTIVKDSRRLTETPRKPLENSPLPNKAGIKKFSIRTEPAPLLESNFRDDPSVVKNIFSKISLKNMYSRS